MLQESKGFQVPAIKINSNNKYQMVRQAVRQAHGPEQSRRTHHLTTLSQVEGQITMIEIQTSKQLAFDHFLDLNIVIWNLFVIWCL
jgi:hypothetical protein